MKQAHGMRDDINFLYKFTNGNGGDCKIMHEKNDQKVLSLYSV